MPSQRPVAIIPARGGSKRLPRKNILELDGRPLLVHTVGHAFDSGVFSQVIVSTDDDEIAAIALKAGATVHERGPALIHYEARIRDVCFAVLQEMPDVFQNVDNFCVLSATSALRLPEDIVESHEIFRRGYRFVTSVCRYFFYPHAALYVDEAGMMRHWRPELSTCQGQEVPDFFVENGAINWCDIAAFTQSRELLGNNAWFYMMPHYRSIDVDTEEDFIALKAIYQYLRKPKPSG